VRAVAVLHLELCEIITEFCLEMIELYQRAPETGLFGKESAVPNSETKRYVNVRTNTLVEVFNQGSGILRIATVSADGYGRRRTAPATSFHEHYLAGNGQPHTSGYVPVSTLPGNHPRAMKTEIDRMELLENLDSLSNEELAQVIREHQQTISEAEAVVERAKTIAKGRRREPGLELHGNVAMVFSPNKRFDPKTAARTLAPQTLAKISVLKPDATRAKAILGEESDLYKACLKDNGFKLEVREATDDDRLKALAEQGSTEGLADEVFELDEPPF
jgi:hypothetical protein